MTVVESPAYTLPPAAAQEPVAPRWPLWGVFAAATLVGGVVLARGLGLLVPETPTVAAVGTLAFGLYAVFWMWLLGRAALFKPLDARTKVLAFVWGGVATTGIAVLANAPIIAYVTEHLGRIWGPAFGGPFTEESFKTVGIAVVLLLMTPRPRTSLDGLLVGAWVGLGFYTVEAVVNTMADTWSMAPGTRDTVVAVANSIINRGLFGGWFSHMTFSAIAGFGIGYFLTRRDRTGRRWVVLVGMVLLAWLGHFLWNAPLLMFLGPLGMLVQGIPFLVLFLYLIKVARREESALFRPYLYWADPRVVSADQIAALASPQGRKRARRAGDGRAEKARQRQRSRLATALATRDVPAADSALASLAKR